MIWFGFFEDSAKLKIPSEISPPLQLVIRLEHPFEAIESAPIVKKQTFDYDNLLWLESVLVVETLLHQSVGSFPKESQKYIEGGSNNSVHHYYKHCIFL